MRIKGNTLLRDRKKIEIQKKYKEEEISTHLSKPKKKEIEYEYYVCDYCGEPIIIKDKWEERAGGTVTFPVSITGLYPLKLALHNKCLNFAKNEFANEIASSFVKANDSHIPRLD